MRQVAAVNSNPVKRRPPRRPPGRWSPQRKPPVPTVSRVRLRPHTTTRRRQLRCPTKRVRLRPHTTRRRKLRCPMKRVRRSSPTKRVRLKTNNNKAPQQAALCFWAELTRRRRRSVTGGRKSPLGLKLFRTCARLHVRACAYTREGVSDDGNVVEGADGQSGAALRITAEYAP